MPDVLPFRQRLEWNLADGSLHDGPVRYLLIRPDTLMATFAALPEPARAQALAAFAAATRRFGARSAARYQAMGAAAADQLMRTIEETAPQLGWGHWSLAGAAAGRFTLELRNSPFAEGFGASGHPVCAPVAGMLAAVTGLISGLPMQAEETDCAAMGAAVCRFQAHPCPEERLPNT